jgi:hypothetical protein
VACLFTFATLTSSSFRVREKQVARELHNVSNLIIIQKQEKSSITSSGIDNNIVCPDVFWFRPVRKA